jgi:hypothetical protein
LVVEDMGEGTAEISLLDKPGLKPSHWRAISEALVGAGFERAVFERHREGGAIELRKIKAARAAGE